MTVNTVFLWISAIGCLLGGLDRILGNRFGLGKSFEEGFGNMGPLALGMGGLICLSPVLANLIGPAISPLLESIGCDPAIFGAILPNDTGGYPLSMALADDVNAGLYSGLIVSSMFGATLTFLIPVGFSMLEKDEHPFYARGMLIGLIAIPFGCILGGLIAGFDGKMVLINTLPVLILVIFICVGLKAAPQRVIKCCLVFGRIIMILCTAGIACAAFESLTGIAVIPGMTSIYEPLEIVAQITVVLMGMIPISTLFIRFTKKPLSKLGKKIDMDATASACIFIAAVNLLPVFPLFKEMKPRGKVAVAAFSACASAALGDHLGFTAGVAPDYLFAVIAGKFAGGILAFILTLLFVKDEK